MLKQLRESKGMTQAALAEASGVSVRMIQYYEQGANDITKAEVMTIYRLAKALGCQMEDIIKGED